MPKENQPQHQVRIRGPQKLQRTGKARRRAHTPRAAHYLELLLLEYNLRKCILFKDNMLRTEGKL